MIEPENYPLITSYSVGELLLDDEQFYSLEGADTPFPSRWSGPRTEFDITLDLNRSREVLVCLIVFGSVSPHNIGNVIYEVSGSMQLAEAFRRERVSIISSKLPRRIRSGPTRIRYHLLETVQPGKGDSRRLGLSVYRVEVRDAESRPYENVSQSFEFKESKLVPGADMPDWRDALLVVSGVSVAGRQLAFFSIKLFRVEDALGFELRPNFAGELIDWNREFPSDPIGKYFRLYVNAFDAGDNNWIKIAPLLSLDERICVEWLIESLSNIVLCSRSEVSPTEKEAWLSCASHIQAADYGLVDP